MILEKLKMKRTIKFLDILQVLFALFMTVSYIYFLFFTDYLDSWYLQIGAGVASIGALVGGIMHLKKRKK